MTFIEKILLATTIIFFMVAILGLVKLRKSKDDSKKLYQKYKPIADVDTYIANIRKEASSVIQQKEQQLNELEKQIKAIHHNAEIEVQNLTKEKESKLAAIQYEIEQNLILAKKEASSVIQQKEKQLNELEKQIETLHNNAKIKTENLIKEREAILAAIQSKIEQDKVNAKEVTENLSAIHEAKIKSLQEDYSSKYVFFEKLTKELSLLEETSEIISYGLYEPHFDFDTSEKYKKALLKVREQEKFLIKNETATHSSTTWTVNGSASEGKKQTKNYIKLMLRAFNGECEALMADVRWNNVSKMEMRLQKAHEAINKLGETHKIEITQNYSQLKMDELRLTHEYQEKLHREKEEARRIQEQIREEQRIQKDIDKALKDSDDEEKRYIKALEQARKEIEKAQGEKLEEVKTRMNELEKELENARMQKQRALSMAQLTKAGHVYVISNIGSFGENVYKIGMTRRLEPLERIRELSGASVPFQFDVHAMLFSEDAPALENMLHKEFYNHRINMINERKEFFNVHINEIENVAKKYQKDVEFIRVAEARDYRESSAIREKQNITSVVKNNPIEKFPATI